MQTTTVRLYSLGYGQAKTYWTAFLFVAGNVLLPQLCHLFPLGGVRWLPIYFFTLVGAYKYGWRVPAIGLKSVLLAGAAGFAAARFRKASLGLLAAVVAFYQVAGTLGEWALTGSWHMAVQDFRIGIPGMLLQILGGWLFINRLIRR